ncbi:MAG: DUF2325 domain-containing protein [Peptococcaceae bacterium]|nr:DUF2325 domain-containing protein [Peptococcaceae bacterium]
MKIVLIGGHDRMHQEYKGICAKQGYGIKVYTQMPVNLEKVIGRPDCIVIFTSTVSHVMVHAAVKAAKSRNIPLLRSHSSSATSLGEILKQFEEQVTCA